MSHHWYDSWVISIMTHIFLFVFEFIFFKNIWIINLWLTSRQKINKNAQFLILISTPSSLIFSRLMSHKVMIHIFLKWINFNAHKKVCVIIDMTHEALKMTEDGAGAKFSNWPFSISSANNWPWWPLVSTVICRSKWIL